MDEVKNGTTEKIPVSIGVILDESRFAFGDIRPILERYKGNVPVYIKEQGTGKTYKAQKELCQDASEEGIKSLRKILGDDNVVVKFKQK